jgi:squalene cyclase
MSVWRSRQPYGSTFLLTSLDQHASLNAMTSASDFLERAQNRDGGWGYRVGGMSYVEPTAAALIALRSAKVALPSLAERALDWLLSFQHPDGGWGIGAVDSESGWMTSWAVLALASLPDALHATRRGVDWLLDAAGIALVDPGQRAMLHDLLRIDSSLRGWPWRVGDAAWVHPTALAILALVAAGQGRDRRVQEGVKFLVDRAVTSGGWNVGDPQMIGQSLLPTIQETAIALLALHAAGQNSESDCVASGIRFLRTGCERATSGADLAWGTLALRRLIVPVAGVSERLAARQAEDGSWQHNPFITSIALMAQGEKP